MGCSFRYLREEFRLINFGFGGVHPDSFYTFWWRPPPIIYLVYRILMAAYTLAVLIISASHHASINGRMPWSAFLTNWTFVALTIHMIYHLILTIVTFIHRGYPGKSFIKRTDKDAMNSFTHQTQQNNSYNMDPNDHSEDNNKGVSIMSILNGILWISYNYVSSGSVMVTIVFWAVLVPGSSFNAMNTDNIQLHLVNSVIVLLEHCLSIIPIRLLHCIYPIIYGLIYVIFTAIYWAEDHSHVLYNILDYSNPGFATACIFLIGLVLIPLIHLSFFGIHLLKLLIIRKFTSAPYP